MTKKTTSPSDAAGNPANDSDTQTPTATEQPKFEVALEELEQLVQQLEAGDLTLEDSLAAFERGVTLTRHCQSALERAQLKVQTLTQTDDGWALKDFEAADDPEQ